MKAAKFIIYGLFDPRDGELRYVGKSVSGLSRLTSHVAPAALRSRTHKTSWIRGLLAVGLRPVIHAIQEFPAAADLCPAEIYWIAQFRTAGCRLTNGTDGGDGVLGRMMSVETRAKLSAAHTGRVVGPEGRANIGAAKRGQKHSAEARAKMSAARVGKAHGPMSAATKAKISAANAGRKAAPEVAARQRLRVATPETRAKMSAARRGVPKSADHRAKISEANRRRWLT